MHMLFILDNLKSNGEDRAKRKVKEAKNTRKWRNAPRFGQMR